MPAGPQRSPRSAKGEDAAAVPSPPPAGTNMTTVSVQFDQSDLDALREYAASHDRSLASVVRLAVKAWLA